MNAHGWLTLAALAVAAPSAGQATTSSASADSEVVSSAAPLPATVALPSVSPEFPRGRIGGLAFGDVYYNLSGDPDHFYLLGGTDLGKANPDGSGPPITKDLNGAQIRRIYFQLDNDLSAKYATRLRLEVDGRALTSDGRIGVFLKNAYLQVKGVVPRGDFFFGMVGTPLWETPEEFWQYRAVEKTQADFRGLGSASDLGVALRGAFDSGRRIGYSAVVGNGQGVRPEDNRYKRWYLALPVRLGGLQVEPFADYENVPGGRDRVTWRLFAGYDFGRLAIGAEALDRVNHRPAGGWPEPFGLSVFARGRMTGSLAGFARFDLWQPNRHAADRVDQQLWIAGLDWQPLPDVHVMPNVEALQYLAKGAGAAPGHHDLQARVTFYYRFSRPQS